MFAKRLYVLDTGYLETDKNNVVNGATMGTKDHPVVNNLWIKLPVLAFLIETASGYILYDTGCHPKAMEGHWMTFLQQAFPLTQKESQRIENQLALCGIRSEDIHTVVLSHLHMDHAGGLDQFAHADVYVPKAEFQNAMTMVHMSTDPMDYGGYIKAELEIPVKRYHLVEEDFEVAPGVEIINLPGHAPGLLGLVVHLEEQVIILPQDAVYTAENYGPPIRQTGRVYDPFSYEASIRKVRALQEKYEALVIFAHDEMQVPKLKVAPEYYS